MDSWILFIQCQSLRPPIDQCIVVPRMNDISACRLCLLHTSQVWRYRISSNQVEGEKHHVKGLGETCEGVGQFSLINCKREVIFKDHHGFVATSPCQFQDFNMRLRASEATGNTFNSRKPLSLYPHASKLRLCL